MGDVATTRALRKPRTVFSLQPSRPHQNLSLGSQLIGLSLGSPTTTSALLWSPRPPRVEAKFRKLNERILIFKPKGRIKKHKSGANHETQLRSRGFRPHLIDHHFPDTFERTSRFSHSPHWAIGSGWRFDRVAYKHKIFCSKSLAGDVLPFFQIKRPQIYGNDPES